VIAFAEGYITEFVSTIKGHKAAWIHIDYKRYLDYTGNRNEDGIYESFDRIVIPSHFSTKSFEEVYPKLKKRICVVPNMIDTTHIKRLSMQNANMDYIFESYKGVKIVSVGRICNEKRFFEIPAIAKELVAQGVKFKWYIIGDGSAIETNVLKDSIQTNIVSDYVILLGRKDNPYPYIADSDLLVSTSLSETFSYVVFEAKALGTPVICADFGTAPEILNETEGIISPIDGMADVIKNLLSNRAKHEQLKNNLQNYRYDNQIILDRINQIVTNI
jgi:glycosyltransferase involved in cell wall biosynthesis